MVYTVKENTDGRFVLVAPNGNFARNTNCEFFMTPDRAKADAAAEYINAGKPRTAAHWLKSTFGTAI